MAANDFKRLYRIGFTTLGSCQKRANRRPIPREVVALALLQVPSLSLANLMKAVGREGTLAIVHGVELARRGIKTFEDLLGIVASLRKQGLGERCCCFTCGHF